MALPLPISTRTCEVVAPFLTSSTRRFDDHHDPAASRDRKVTRRRDHSVPQECWRVYYGDLHAGTIAQCVGNPSAAPKWQWRCGFYPGSRPGECTGGTAATFNEARKAFEAAWRVFLAKRTEADFQVWRDQRDWTAEKYRRFDRGEQMPPDWRPVV